MAKVTIAATMPEYLYWADFFEPSEATVSSATATVYSYEREDGYRISFAGSGLSYDPDDASVPIGGTFTSVTVRNASNAVLFTITGMSTDAVDIYYRINGYNDEGGSGFDAISQLLVGNDTINGSENGDDISAGTQEGDDTIYAKGGDDYVKGDRGNDRIDGGSGYDTLSYEETIYNRGAFRGINLDTAAGTVTDAWGGTDIISNFEEFRGSSFADVMKGSEGGEDGETWMGLRGADTIDGGAGYDEVRYNQDARFGGNKGINANLQTGVIYDGWGQRDTVANIEAVAGTQFNDTFVGTANDDRFRGFAGVDSYNGGTGGNDMVRFRGIENFGAKVGVTVNLSLASGQIINDGFGNVETTVSIEDIDGSKSADKITGSNVANYLRGRDGNDTLNGLGGGDRIEGEEGDDQINGGLGNDKLTGGVGNDSFAFNTTLNASTNLDTISDFANASGNNDRFLLDNAVFAKLTATGTLAAGFFAANTTGTAKDANDYIVYETDTGKVFYDADGNGSGAKVQFATMSNFASLTGTAALTAADFIVV